ncbi:AAA family ATPase [Aetokthonos hydrillicola Thurmond2011]|jgi:predicted ATP-binding protein involved in virulence|uniref:AAA family ATPase n=1 Tax=Aetokthonos hydrillicola Thurmond2011 TaxID=2712845 RepID=A0AAP5MCC8_9CYAN|nr:AAA family ATPase [Aetokthonos hydrillicola]MBO3457198.1 AAA family ATPase [Aetokthonos hydrillicola CCALA 1050]MBW4587549.1 AAA family ATPase [Aetokthonos hydrillicola CCALA 1050]MDR9900185.1 AAA family ATPase [Aetokthonos hydrillicola Thurmond2011]
MHIEKLHIQNFRGLQEIILNFHQTNLAVFIGINGAGKSSILDCMAIMLDQFVARLRNNLKLKLSLTENDINVNSNSTINTITIETGQGEKLSWKMVQERVSKQDQSNYDEINSYIKRIQNNLINHSNLNLPVMVYYQTHRMVLKNPYTFKSKNSNKAKKEVHHQFYAYEKAFSTGVNDFQDFFDWFKQEEDYENEIRLRESRNYRNPKLEIVRRAITNFLERFSDSHFSDLRVVRSTTNRDFHSDKFSSQPSLTITKNRQDLRLEQLSDGEKMLLMLVTDLARRLAIANPSSNDPLSEEGIVLIDEIDLHLHPQWQRNVIDSLTQTFPNCQFIVSTHSPQVLSRVKKENVFILENSYLVENTPHTYGKDSNSILYELMNVKERPDEIQQQINHCFQLIDDGELEAAKSALNELSDLLGENDSEVVRANTLIGFLED